MNVIKGFTESPGTDVETVLLKGTNVVDLYCEALIACCYHDRWIHEGPLLNLLSVT